MGLSGLELSGFARLKEVEVRDWCLTRICKIKIDLLSLHSFCYQGEIPESHIDLIACENLEMLKLSSSHLTERVCEDLVSKLPCLKSLKLGGSQLKRVNISSEQLENLHLSSLKEAIIDAPNLVSFNYHTKNVLPSEFSMDKSSLREVSFSLCYINIELDPHYLLKAREFLGYFDQITSLHMSFAISKSSYDLPERFKELSVPALLDIKQLNLNIDSKSKDEAALVLINNNVVDGLLWMCRPRCLLLSSGSGLNNEFMKVLCRRLRMNKVEGLDRCSCASSLIKCWRHVLKGFHIELVTGNGDEGMTLTCDAFLELLPKLEPDRQTIRFVFKW